MEGGLDFAGRGFVEVSEAEEGDVAVISEGEERVEDFADGGGVGAIVCAEEGGEGIEDEESGVFGVFQFEHEPCEEG